MGGMPGPRWNRNKGIYPTSIRRYRECPHRCRLEYVEQVPFDQPPWNRAMEVGNALHKVMERVGKALRDKRPPPPIASFRPWVETMLPAHEYGNPGDRKKDVENVLFWAELGQDYLTEAGTEVLIVEHYTPRRWNDTGELGRVLLGAKADAVLRRSDDRGRFIEIVDYKTGRNRDHTEFTPMLSRIALDKRIRAALASEDDLRVVFTYIWFEADEIDQRDLSRQSLLDQWRELKRLLTRMVHEETWPKRPHPRTCRYCPYFNTVCVPFARTSTLMDHGLPLYDAGDRGMARNR